MPYDAVPNTGQTLGQTRDQIRNNIGALKSSLAVNHFDLDTGNVGKHQFVSLVSLGSFSNPPTTAFGENALYTNRDTNLNMYMRSESNGQAYRLTSIDDGNFPLFGTNTTYNVGPPILMGGWTFLPGGLLFQYGLINPVPKNTPVVIAFPKPFASFGVYSITANTFNLTTVRPVGILAITNSTFTVAVDDLPITSILVYWQAIGKAP